MFSIESSALNWSNVANMFMEVVFLGSNYNTNSVRKWLIFTSDISRSMRFYRQVKTGENKMAYWTQSSHTGFPYQKH